MKTLTYLWSLILDLIRTLAYGWFLALVSVVRRLLEIWRLKWDRRMDGRAGKASKSPCNPITEPAYHRPDPMIYAQYDLMAQGFAVTWDNPDISFFKGGVPITSPNLLPGTEYEIVARIWNKTPDAPIVAMPLQFFFLSFGNGIKGTFIGATAATVGVKGGPDHPAFAPMKWVTPVGPGHYCVIVLLTPVDDLDFKNNLGQKNLNVATPHSPADFTFQLRNEKERAQVFRFETDTYRIPERPPCGQQPRAAQRGEGRADEGPRQPETGAKVVPPEHDRRNHPIPPGWLVEINPQEPHLAAAAEMTVHARITAPAHFRGSQPFNVNVFDSEGFTGGVTLVVEAP